MRFFFKRKDSFNKLIKSAKLIQSYNDQNYADVYLKLENNISYLKETMFFSHASAYSACRDNQSYDAKPDHKIFMQNYKKLKLLTKALNRLNIMEIYHNEETERKRQEKISSGQLNIFEGWKYPKTGGQKI